VKISQLLKALAALEESCLDQGSAAALQQFAILCTDNETKTVSAFVSLVINARAAALEQEQSTNQSGPKVQDLIPYLELVKRIYAAAGVKTPEDDMTNVLRMLKGHESRPLTAFVAEVRSSLVKPRKRSQETTRKRKTKPKQAELNQDVVQSYVQRLRDTESDRIAFDAVLAELAADERTRLVEIVAISRGYTEYSTNYKKKDGALGDIKKVFIQRARFENKIRTDA
jgi:hypothetical protein